MHRPAKKTEKLIQHADALTGSDIPIETLSETSTFVPNGSKDVSGPQALGCAFFLEGTYKEPSAAMPEITQLTWLCLEEPTKDDSIQDKSGTRLWFVTKARDASGAMTLGIPEKKL